MTNIRVAGRSGTELVTSEIATCLARDGAAVAVYTSLKGPFAQGLAARGIVVTDRIASLAGFAPDLIHGHHNSPFLVARAAFPAAPAVWCCHDYRSVWDRPPPAASAQLFIAHSDQKKQRMELEGGIPQERIRMLPNSVDLDAFVRADPPPPRSALIVGKSPAASGGLCAVAAALRDRGWLVTCIGPGLGEIVEDLSPLIAAHQVVISSGRVVLEALAVGRAVICADDRGLAGLVTPTNFHALRRRNFGGAAMLHDLHPDAVLAEIDAVDDAGQRVLDTMARPEIGFDLYMERLRAIHEEARAIARAPAAGDAMRGAETLEALLTSQRVGGFGPDQTRHLREDHAARLGRMEGQAARLTLRLKLATLKPQGRLPVSDWHRGAGAALLGQGWMRGDGTRVVIAGRGVIDLTEALGQRRLARIVLRLERLDADDPATAIDAMDGARILAPAPVQDGVATFDLAMADLTQAGVKAFGLQPRDGSGGGWALVGAELVAAA